MSVAVGVRFECVAVTVRPLKDAVAVGVGGGDTVRDTDADAVGVCPDAVADLVAREALKVTDAALRVCVGESVIDRREPVAERVAESVRVFTWLVLVPVDEGVPLAVMWESVTLLRDSEKVLVLVRHPSGPWLAATDGSCHTTSIVTSSSGSIVGAVCRPVIVGGLS